MRTVSGNRLSAQKSRVLSLFCISLLLAACGLFPRVTSQTETQLGVTGTCNVSLPLLANAEVPNSEGSSTPYPVTDGTPIPSHLKSIEPENASEVIQLARWGKGTIDHLAWSPDRQTIAVASVHGVYLYDTTTYTNARFLSHPDTVTYITFTTDGEKLLTYTQDYVLRFWSAKDGSLVNVFADDRLQGSIVISPDGKLLATSGYSDDNVRIWDITTLTLAQEIPTSGIAQAMAFTPDGAMLATADDFELVHLWRLADGALIRELNKGDWALVDSVAFSPDGEILATGSYGGDIQLWRVSDGRRLRKIDGSIWTIRDLSFNHDGTQLFSSVEGYGPIELWDVDSGRHIRSFDEYGETYSTSHDGELLATTSQDSLHIWQVPDGTLLQTISGTTEFRDVAVSRDGSLIIAGDRNGYIEFRRLTDGKVLCQIRAHRADAVSVSLNSDDSQLASIGYDGDVRIWRIKDGSAISTLPSANAHYIAVFSPDGKYLATGSQGNILTLWRMDDNSLLYQLTTGESDRVNSIAFSPKADFMAAAGYTQIYIWRIADGQLIMTLPADIVSSVTFSPNGKFLAANSSRGVSLWGLDSGKHLYTTEGHSNVVETVAFSPDGRILASGSFDGTIQLWQTSDGSVLGILKGHPRVNKIRFAPDGSLLVSVGSDGTIALWGMP